MRRLSLVQRGQDQARLRVGQIGQDELLQCDGLDLPTHPGERWRLSHDQDRLLAAVRHCDDPRLARERVIVVDGAHAVTRCAWRRWARQAAVRREELVDVPGNAYLP